MHLPERSAAWRRASGRLWLGGVLGLLLLGFGALAAPRAMLMGAALPGPLPALPEPDPAALPVYTPPDTRAEIRPVPELPAHLGGPRVVEMLGTGTASYYGRDLAGRPTASGERFNPDQFTAAHRTLPFGSRVRVTNLRNGRSVVVRINDRGPFSAERVIDISSAAAREIGMFRRGLAQVRVELLSRH